jgi:hypothetical protein
LQRFIAVEEQVLALFSTGEYLDERTVRRSVPYLEKFFQIVKSPRAIQRNS